MTRKASMTPAEAKSITMEVYGSGGQTKLAADIERGEVTVSRWLTGHTPIGSTEAKLLRMLLVLYRKEINWRKWLADYEAENGVRLTLEDLI